MDKENITLKGVINLLCNYKWRNACVMSVFLLLSFLSYMLFPKSYSSEAVILASSDNVAFITELIKSRGVLEPVIQSVYDGVEDEKIPTTEEFAKKRLEISNTKGTGLIRVAGVGKTPEDAQIMVSNVIDVMQEKITKLNQEKLSRIEDFLDQRHENIEKELQIAEKNLEEFEKIHGVYIPDQQIQELLKRYYAYDMAIANLQVRNEALQEEIGIVNIQMGNKNKVTIDSKITDDPVIILIRENIINEEVNLVKLRQTRQDTHKDVVESKEKIDAMYNALDQETLAVAESGIIPVSSIHKELMLQKYQTMTKLNVNVAVESEIRALLAMKEKELDELSSDMREYVMLSRQINIKRNLHNVMSEGVEWVKMFKEWKPIYVAIIDEADTPKSDKPASPNIIIVIAMGSVIGLAVCILSCVRKW